MAWKSKPSSNPPWPKVRVNWSLSLRVMGGDSLLSAVETNWPMLVSEASSSTTERRWTCLASSSSISCPGSRKLGGSCREEEEEEGRG